MENEKRTKILIAILALLMWATIYVYSKNDSVSTVTETTDFYFSVKTFDVNQPQFFSGVEVMPAKPIHDGFVHKELMEKILVYGFISIIIFSLFCSINSPNIILWGGMRLLLFCKMKIEEIRQTGLFFPRKIILDMILKFRRPW